MKNQFARFLDRVRHLYLKLPLKLRLMVLPESFNEVFESKCIILGLLRHQNRIHYTYPKLLNAGFKNIGVFYGVDGFTDDISEWNIDKKLGPGEIGFTLSCIKIWRLIAGSDTGFQVIFEDDALPHPDFAFFAEKWWSYTPKDVDLVYLGNQMNPADPRLTESPVLVNTPAYCTHAYILTKEGAQKLLAYIHLIQMSGGSIMKGDILLKSLTELGLLKVACWNGTLVPKPFPVYTKEVTKVESDMIVWKRDTGLIYQNFLLGTTIHNPQISYIVYE